MRHGKLVGELIEKIAAELTNENIVEVLPAEVALKYYELWVQQFSRGFDPKKSDLIGDYTWHCFDDAEVPVVEGEEAIRLLKKMKVAQSVIVPDLAAWKGEGALIVRGVPSDDVLKVIGDFIIFPKNCAWYLFVTHENGWLGPYFGKHDDFDKLDRKNQQMLAAVEKGYM